MLNLNSFVSISTCDWYGKASAVIFFNECNFRCKHCHNKQTWTDINMVEIEDVKNMIKSSLPFISAVTFSGGEPYVQFNALKELSQYSRNLKLKVAVETNGYFTDRIKQLTVDKIFIDVKAPINDRKDYSTITGIDDSNEKITETLNLNLPVEIRIVDSLDVVKIKESLRNYSYPIRILPFNEVKINEVERI